VALANQRLSRSEQVKRFTILPAEWTAESEELTPTLKLRRRVTHARYAAELEALYADTPQLPGRVVRAERQPPAHGLDAV
jgi:long-subunit acyl-CoA synthetase (AMP-forming)